jgi:hypothetical protein
MWKRRIDRTGRLSSRGSSDTNPERGLTRALATGFAYFSVFAIGALVLAVPLATAQEASDEIEALPSALAQFTTGVENREPIDQVTFVGSDVRKITFFSDLRALAGHTVTHRWIYQGKTVAEIPFVVGGPRWRVWSSKKLLEDWLGDWTVEIVTDDGEVIAAETFTYSASGSSR